MSTSDAVTAAVQPDRDGNRFTKRFLAFTVGISLALAPYLGAVDIPGFTTLYSILPVDIRSLALPLSSAVCGIAALYSAIIWTRKTPAGRLKQPVQRWILVALLFLGAFAAVSLWCLRAVATNGGELTVRFTVGPFARPVTATCPRGMSDASCIEVLTFNPARVRDMWGDASVSIGQALVLVTYLGFIGALGAAIGQSLALSRTVRRTARKRTKRTA